MSGGMAPPREETMTTRLITDAELDRMHERQAAALRGVAVEDRDAVLRHAYFLMNVSGGNLSGNLRTAVRHLAEAGSAEALMQQDRADNARLMGTAFRAR
ncbi:hypothetical protein SEA_PHLEURON_20 [Mycobacterium phage Phleuron]|uniref:Uncharacterized protein n=1 Tax=Mycobacterium phage Phleuron TaxID=2234032 RepID=A0A2Z4Q1M8_9CAUD|nr:hypothetical protein SEA_PHLEURON_20 [Mycobacterium phage Phleuron]